MTKNMKCNFCFLNLSFIFNYNIRGNMKKKGKKEMQNKNKNSKDVCNMYGLVSAEWKINDMFEIKNETCFYFIV